MPKRSNEFQALIKSIYDAMKKVEGGIVTESAILYEPNGTPREVDILVERELYGHKLIIAVECRDRSRIDDIEWIDSLIGKYRNLKVQKIVAVSNSGFSTPALEKANSNGIDTRTLEDCLDKGWPKEFFEFGFMGIEGFGFKINFIPKSIRFEVSPTPSEDVNINSIKEIRNVSGEVLGTVNFILNDYYNRIISPKVNEFINQEFLPSCKYVNDIERGFEITLPVNIENTYLHSIDGKVFKLNKLIYIVKGNPSIYDAKMEHYNYNNQALVSIGNIELNNKKGSLTIIQVSGSKTIEASLKDK